MSVTQMEGHVFGTLVMRITAIKVAKLGQIGGKLGNQRKIHIFPISHFSLERLIFSPNDVQYDFSQMTQKVVTVHEDRK